jgi:uncharacterized membrane protein
MCMFRRSPSIQVRRIPVSDRRVISYLTLRKAVGYLGIALPFVLALGTILIFDGHGLRRSVSSYYYTPMRGVLVGTLWAIGAFLLAYKGYDRLDSWASNLAGLLTIAIGLLPVAPLHHPSLAARIAGDAHLILASLLFGTLAFIAWFLFTKKAPGRPRTQRKRTRDLIYRSCAVIIVVCVMGAAIVHLPAVAHAIGRLRPEFWLEAIAIVAFGVSWLVKGQGIVRDRRQARNWPEGTTPQDLPEGPIRRGVPGRPRRSWRRAGGQPRTLRPRRARRERRAAQA